MKHIISMIMLSGLIYGAPEIDPEHPIIFVEDCENIFDPYSCALAWEGESESMNIPLTSENFFEHKCQWINSDEKCNELTEWIARVAPGQNVEVFYTPEQAGHNANANANSELILGNSSPLYSSNNMQTVNEQVIYTMDCEDLMSPYACNLAYETNGGGQMNMNYNFNYVDPKVKCSWTGQKCNEMTELVSRWDNQIPSQGCGPQTTKYLNPGSTEYDNNTQLWYNGSNKGQQSSENTVPVRIVANCEHIYDPYTCSISTQSDGPTPFSAVNYMEKKCAWTGQKCNEMTEWYGIIKDAAPSTPPIYSGQNMNMNTAAAGGSPFTGTPPIYSGQNMNVNTEAAGASPLTGQTGCGLGEQFNQFGQCVPVSCDSPKACPGQLCESIPCVQPCVPFQCLNQPQMTGENQSENEVENENEGVVENPIIPGQNSAVNEIVENENENESEVEIQLGNPRKKEPEPEECEPEDEPCSERNKSQTKSNQSDNQKIKKEEEPEECEPDDEPCNEPNSPTTNQSNKPKSEKKNEEPECEHGDEPCSNEENGKSDTNNKKDNKKPDTSEKIEPEDESKNITNQEEEIEQENENENGTHKESSLNTNGNENEQEEEQENETDTLLPENETGVSKNNGEVKLEKFLGPRRKLYQMGMNMNYGSAESSQGGINMNYGMNTGMASSPITVSNCGDLLNPHDCNLAFLVTLHAAYSFDPNEKCAWNGNQCVDVNAVVSQMPPFDSTNQFYTPQPDYPGWVPPIESQRVYSWSSSCTQMYLEESNPVVETVQSSEFKWASLILVGIGLILFISYVFIIMSNKRRKMKRRGDEILLDSVDVENVYVRDGIYV